MQVKQMNKNLAPKTKFSIYNMIKFKILYIK